jgi:hypothetical protein
MRMCCEIVGTATIRVSGGRWGTTESRRSTSCVTAARVLLYLYWLIAASSPPPRAPTHHARTYGSWQSPQNCCDAVVGRRQTIQHSNGSDMMSYLQCSHKTAPTLPQEQQWWGASSSASIIAIVFFTSYLHDNVLIIPQPLAIMSPDYLSNKPMRKWRISWHESKTTIY